MKKTYIKRKIISLILLTVLLTTFIVSSMSPNVAYAEAKDLKVGELYHGFKLVEKKDLKDLDSIGRIFQHEKSGARLLQIENDDENKSFSISFRTPVSDDKGMPHILEHVLLNGGSEKYPVKNLFFELVKGTLTKNLNGYTMPDRTTYPFSSMNHKEFSDLMDMYLNMVFKPSFYKDENIFKTDGWHYKIEDEKSPLEYNGVVYNEMKGALSSPDSQLYINIMKSLYPDTNYKYVSGGDPMYIPDLTFEELKGFYDKYYHPSNSYIYLYGKMDILEKLKFINDNYLKDFDKQEVDSKPIIQSPFKKRNELISEYPILNEDSEKDKTFIGFNYSVDEKRDMDTSLSFMVLSYMLFNNPASPVVQDLNKAGFDNIYSIYHSSLIQPFGSIIAQNTNPEMKDEFINILFSSLKNVVEKGIDKDLIKSTLNIIELQQRKQYSRDANTGSSYGEAAMLNWLYDGSPFEGLLMENSLRKLKDSLNTRYFENLVKEYILENTHTSTLVVKPKKGLMEEKTNFLDGKLKAYKESLSKEGLEELINQYKEFQKWNSLPNTEVALNSIPTISVKDLNPEIKNIPTEEKIEKAIKVLHHPLNTNGVGLINLYFDTTKVKQEQIPYINLLSKVLGNLSTEKYHYTVLPIEQAMYTGGIGISIPVFSKPGSNDKYNPKLNITSYSTEENTIKMLELMAELMGNSKFNDKDRLKQLVSNTKNHIESQLNNGDIGTQANRNLSYFSDLGKYKDTLGGLSFYNFIADLDENFDKNYDNIVNNLNEVKNTIFNKENLIISYTGEEKEYNIFKENISTLLKALGDKKLTGQKYKFSFDNKNESFTSSADIVYNSQAFDFKKLGYSYSGKMKILNNILQSDYLTNEIRLKNGAYGAISMVLNETSMAFISYRDPNLKQTYDVYNGIPNYLRNFNMSSKDFEKQIISSLAEYYVQTSNMDKGSTSDYYYFSEISTEDLNKELKEILNTKPEDIRQFAELIEKGLKENNILTIGNEKIIMDNKDFFNSKKNLFK